MRKMTFGYDAAMAAVFAELAAYFGLRTKASVIRRALVITRTAKRNAAPDKTVRFERPDDPTVGETFFFA